MACRMVSTYWLLIIKCNSKLPNPLFIHSKADLVFAMKYCYVSCCISCTISTDLRNKDRVIYQSKYGTTHRNQCQININYVLNQH